MIWVVLVFLMLLGASINGPLGMIGGVVFWCVFMVLYGLWSLVDYGYDCSAEYDQYGTYVSERCS